MRRLLFPIIIALGLSLVTAPSLADTEAESLFQQALTDMRAADFVSACPKLARSQELEAKSGTLISLAFCHEKLGRTATAWRNYRDAAELAAQEGRDDYASKAEGLAAELLPRLANLRIQVSAIDGLTLTVAGVVVAPEDLNDDIHVDPGRITVVAEAPGHETWTNTIDIGTEERKTVVVPHLESIASPAPTRPAAPATTSTVPPADDPGPSAGAVAGYTLIGVGGAASIAGLVLGGLVLGEKATVEEECDQSTRECTRAGLEARDSGATLSVASTATLIGGLALAGVGVTILLLTDGDGDEDGRAAALTLAPLPGGGALTLRGTL